MIPSKSKAARRRRPAATSRRGPKRGARGSDAATEASILDAARSIFAKRGYAGATTRAISRRAGVNQKLLYYYFGSKQDLYGRVLRDFFDDMGKLFLRTREQALPARERYDRLVDALNDLIAGHLEEVKIVIREIIDEGPHMDTLIRPSLLPLIEGSEAAALADRARGELAGLDARHLVLTFGGANLVYYLVAPILRQKGYEPLSAEALRQRKAEVRKVLFKGL